MCHACDSRVFRMAYPLYSDHWLAQACCTDVRLEVRIRCVHTCPVVSTRALMCAGMGPGSTHGATAPLAQHHTVRSTAMQLLRACCGQFRSDVECEHTRGPGDASPAALTPVLPTATYNTSPLLSRYRQSAQYLQQRRFAPAIHRHSTLRNHGAVLRG